MMRTAVLLCLLAGLSSPAFAASTTTEHFATPPVDVEDYRFRAYAVRQETSANTVSWLIEIQPQPITGPKSPEPVRLTPQQADGLLTAAEQLAELGVKAEKSQADIFEQNVDIGTAWILTFRREKANKQNVYYLTGKNIDWELSPAEYQGLLKALRNAMSTLKARNI